jgi:serine/threonine-protein kinase
LKLCTQCETGYPDSESTCPHHGERLTQTRDLPPGLLIGGAYRIQSKLGQGSMGSVYLAEQIPGGERKALKFLSPEFRGDESFTSRFERAAKKLSDLHHPNVLATGELQRAEDDALFFSREYVDGPSLRVLLNIAPDLFDPGLVLSIARCVAEGLKAAHANGFIHLDLKPENIFIARDADSLAPKIANFGFGATQEDGETFLTAGRKLFTPAYAAPEQWLDSRTEQLDGRIDLYALGGVLFEMLTRETVFHADGYHAWAQQHLTAQPRTPSELRPELAVWRGLDDLVLALLAKDPNDRPADAATVLELLDAVQFGSRFLQIPRIHFVEDSHPIEDEREQEALPPAKPAEEPEAGLGTSSAVTSSAVTSSIVEPVAEEEPASAEEAPVLFNEALTPEPAAVEAEPEPAPPPNAFAPMFTEPEPVEELVAPESIEEIEEPVVAQELPHFSDPEFAPPEPEFIPPAEAEPILVASPVLAANFTEPEPVDEPVTPETVDVPVVTQELPHFSDPEFPPPEPEFIPPVEPEPILIASPVLTTAITEPEPADEPVTSESNEEIEEPVVVQELPHFSDPEFAPPEPEFIPPAEPEPIPIDPPVLPTTFTQPEPVEKPVTPESIEEIEEPVVAQELPHFSDPEFAPPEPEFIPPAEAEPILIAPPVLAKDFTAPEPVDEPVIATEPPLYAVPEFKPSAPEFMPDDAPELPSVFSPPVPADDNPKEPNLDMEELNRLFGRGDLGVKFDDVPNPTTGAASSFGPTPTDRSDEEWPAATAEPTNFFGEPYTPAVPEAPPLLVPELSADFGLTDTSTELVDASGQPDGEDGQPVQTANVASWFNTGKAANPSTFLPFSGAHSVLEIDNERLAVKADGKSGGHGGRTLLIGFAVVLLLAAAGFAFWRYQLYEANQPMAKMTSACSAGDGKACYDLGAWYAQTKTVSDGETRAAVLYSRACDLNLPMACRKLGLKYLFGTGVVRDDSKAIELFTKGCDRADAESCDHLGDIYHDGKGVPMDDVKAAAIYDKACTAGDAVGCKWAKLLATPPPPPKPVLRHVAPAAADSDTTQ